MRIGLVLPNTPQYSETFFINKIKLLTECGHTVFLFARKTSHLENVKVIEPYEVSTLFVIQCVKTIYVLFKLMLCHPCRVHKFIVDEIKDGLSWSCIAREMYINSHILCQKLDWLHFGFLTMGLGRENVAQAIGAKAAVSIRGYDVSIYPLKRPGCYNRLWKKIDKVHTISDDLLEEAYLLGLPKSITVVKITPAINWRQFKVDVFDRHLVTPLRLLTVGRLAWKKGYEYAFLALALLKQRGVAFTYSIIGEGPDKERLVFAAYQLGIADHVRFVGVQPPQNVAVWMRESSVYLQPSVQEGFCNAVLEAQASGLICVVTNAEGLSENVLDGQTGFVVPKRNPQAMAEKINEIIAMSEEERSTIQKYAMERVRVLFNLDLQQRKWAAFYSA